MQGYPICIKLLIKVYKNRINEKNYALIPEVAIMIVVHNEEKVIKDKVMNVCNIDYSKEKN